MPKLKLNLQAFHRIPQTAKKPHGSGTTAASLEGIAKNTKPKKISKTKRLKNPY